MDRIGISRRLKLQVLHDTIPINGISFPLDIYRAPVLLVHGLWGGKASFKKMYNDFKNTSFCAENTMLKVDYNGDNNGAARSFAENSSVLWKNINSLFLQARKGMFSVGKVDIIAHSMGGLLSRLYINDKSQIPYRFDIHKLITIDAPNLGTQAANLLLSSWGDNARTLLELRHKSTGSGAVENLRVNSSAMSDLNAPPLNNHGVPFYSINNSISFVAAGLFDGSWDKVLINYTFYSKRCEYLSQFGLQNPQDLLNYIYYYYFRVNIIIFLSDGLCGVPLNRLHTICKQNKTRG